MTTHYDEPLIRSSVISFLSGIKLIWLEVYSKTPVKWVYYSPIKITTRKDLYCHCTKNGVKADKEEKKVYI